MCEDSPYIPENIKTIHEQIVKKAIIDQNDIGWHQYMRGFHSKIWNSAFIQWNNETGNKNSTHLWNEDAIPAMLTFAISVWSERCSEIKKRRVSAEHETLLNRAKILLNDIRQRPIISSQDFYHLHTSDENIENIRTMH